MNLNENTLPTNGMPLLAKVWYLSRKLINLILRYRKNPTYLFTYLRFIADGSYKENVHFMTDENFLNEAHTRSSLRLQDGEFTLFLGTRDVIDEKANPRLTAIYQEAIKNYSDKSLYMIGLPPFISINNETLHQHAFKYLWMPSKVLFRLMFPKAPQYFNGSYFYIDNTVAPFIQKLSQGRNVIVVTNGNNIQEIKKQESLFFPSANTTHYVETPSSNTFRVYDEIVSKIKDRKIESPMVFMACGAAGKAMIYDLAKEGIVAHDVGWGFTDGALTHKSREHFIKWDVFGPIFKKIQQS